jgi:hypothetical protein
MTVHHSLAKASSRSRILMYDTLGFWEIGAAIGRSEIRAGRDKRGTDKDVLR